MSRVVICEQYGGFGLSRAAMERMRELGWVGKHDADVKRDDPLLLRVIDEMGTHHASGAYAALRVIEVPDGVKWHVHEYDGFETIHEDHRSWGSDGLEQNC